MTEQEALARMVAPGTRRPGKYREGVIQIHVTRACDKSCFNCTQGSQLGGKPTFITVEQFAAAVESLRGYFGVVGTFGGNPALSPHFEEYCRVLRESWVPFNQRGLWCNNPVTEAKAKAMRATFDPSVSNLNVHLDAEAYRLFRQHWPECRPVGLREDSRHSPCYVALKDVLKKDCPDCGTLAYMPIEDGGGGAVCSRCNNTGKVYDESRAWELISNCDINKHWSAMIGVFRGELRAWFCEIAGAQAMLHQDEPDYPDTGIPIGTSGLSCTSLPPTVVNPYYAPTGDTIGGRWWMFPMRYFAGQVRKHCHDCGVPLRGHGELAQADLYTHPQDHEVGIAPKEQVSATHADVYKPKRKGRRVELVTVPAQLGAPLAKMTDYLGNARRP